MPQLDFSSPMIQFFPGSQVWQLITVLSLVGEYPNSQRQLLGDKENLRLLINKALQTQTYRNRLTGDTMTCKLLTVSGKGASKTIRFFKGTLPILTWLHPDAYEHYIKLSRYADVQPEGRCQIPVNLILDEFNNVGRIGGAEDGSDFARSLSVVRSRDIRVMIAVQSLGQLQNRYPKNLWSEIIGNMDIQLMMGCSDDVSAEFFSARSGDMSVQVNTTMTVRQTIAVAQVIPQYRHMEGHGRRRLLTPDEVLRLPNEEMLCIIRGHNVLKLDKLDYTKHPMSKKIVRKSIMDYNPAPPVAQSHNTEPVQEEPPKKKSSRKRNLYSTAQPPTGF